MTLRERLPTAGLNPFLGAPQPAGPSAAPGPVEDGPATFVAGPQVPVGCAPVMNPVLGRQPMPSTATVAVVGCHGGAGATSVATALSDHLDVHDHGQCWPTEPVTRQLPPLVLLVARTTGHGLEAAVNAAREWGSNAVPWVQLVGLVLVADAPTVHPDLRTRIESSLGTTPRGWLLPWQEQWRPLPVTERPVKRPVRKLITSIAQAITDQRLRDSPSPSASVDGSHRKDPSL